MKFRHQRRLGQPSIWRCTWHLQSHLLKDTLTTCLFCLCLVNSSPPGTQEQKWLPWWGWEGVWKEASPYRQYPDCWGKLSEITACLGNSLLISEPWPEVGKQHPRISEQGLYPHFLLLLFVYHHQESQSACLCMDKCYRLGPWRCVAVLQFSGPR